MKKIYLPILLLTLAVSSCDTFDKVPSSEWPSEGAIKTLEDLQFAVNGVYESQTSSIDAGTNPRESLQPLREPVLRLAPLFFDDAISSSPVNCILS